MSKTHPHDQAVAAALSTARRYGKADGGGVVEDRDTTLRRLQTEPPLETLSRLPERANAQMTDPRYATTPFSTPTFWGPAWTRIITEIARQSMPNNDKQNGGPVGFAIGGAPGGHPYGARGKHNPGMPPHMGMGAHMPHLGAPMLPPAMGAPRMGFAPGGWIGEGDTPADMTRDILPPRSPVPEWLLSQQAATKAEREARSNEPGPVEFQEHPWLEAATRAGAEMTGIPSALRASTAAHEGRYRDAAGQAALAALPWAAGPFAPMAARAFTAYPRLTGSMAGLGALATPSEAANDAPVKDYTPPGLGREIMTALGLGKPDAERPLTRDEYRQQHSQFTPRAESDFIKDEQDKVQNSKEFKDSQSPGYRKNRLAEAEKKGRDLYASNQKSLTDEQKRIDASYNDYVEGWKQQRQEHLSKPFVERNPIAGTALTYGAPLASALATRLGFGAIDKYGTNIAERGLAARASDNVRNLADSLESARRYQWWAPTSKAAIFGESAAMPIEARMAADFGDANALPPDAPARKAAEARLADKSQYVSKGEQNLVSGGIGALTGALLNKMPVVGTPSPAVDLATVRAQGRGIPSWEWGLPPRRLSPDEMAVPLAARIKSAREAQAGLAEGIPARLGAPIGDALPAGGPAPLTGEVLAPGVAVAPPASTPRLAARLPEYQKAAGPLPAPAASPSPPALSAPTKPPVELPEGWRHVPAGRGSQFHDENGDFAVLPKKYRAKSQTKSKTSPAPAKGNGSKTSADDLEEIAPGVPKKPVREPGPDDPGFKRDGGRIPRRDGGALTGALETARRYAHGGAVHTGPVIGPTGGREDAKPVDVPAGAYILPADIVSAIGGGNTLAGCQKLEKMFGSSRSRMAAGGQAVPIAISDGEYAVAPDAVAKVGRGDMDMGHKILDAMVLKVRRDHIKQLQSLPGPQR